MKSFTIIPIKTHRYENYRCQCILSQWLNYHNKNSLHIVVLSCIARLEFFGKQF